MQTDNDDVELFNRRKEEFKMYRTNLRKSMLNVHILSAYLHNIKMVLTKTWKILNETLSRNTNK